MAIRKIDFEYAAKRLQEVGSISLRDREIIAIDNAREVLGQGLRYFVGEDAWWLPEYDAVAEWLADNAGKGLLCAGNIGRGKSVLCGQVLPCIIHGAMNKIVHTYTAREAGKNIDSALRSRYIFVDDIGTEDTERTFGNRIDAVPMLIDEAEKKGNLLLLTTNLSFDELKAKYGERTTDRLRSICKVVVFKGRSLRK